MDKQEGFQVTQEEAQWLNDLASDKEKGVGLPFVIVEQFKKDCEEARRVDTLLKNLQEEVQKCNTALIRLDASISNSSIMLIKMKREEETKKNGQIPYEIG